MTNFEVVLKALIEAKVTFVVVGAFAAVAQGFSQPTGDLDICYERSLDNLKRLAAALDPLHPRLRGVPQTPFKLDAEALAHGMNFTLETDAGDVDLLGELSGIGQFGAVSRDSRGIQLFEVKVQVASLSTVIRSKQAAGRPKDLRAIPELEALNELQRAAEAEDGDKDS